jgi:hypothetical protein
VNGIGELGIYYEDHYHLLESLHEVRIPYTIPSHILTFSFLFLFLSCKNNLCTTYAVIPFRKAPFPSSLLKNNLYATYTIVPFHKPQ